MLRDGFKSILKRKIKPLLYLIPVSMSFWPILIAYLVLSQGWNPHWMAFVPVFLFAVTPIMDFLWGKDPEVNPQVEKGSRLHRYYETLPLLCVPGYLILVMSTPWILNLDHPNQLFTFRYILSVGLLGGVIAINVAHELIHRTSKFERLCGGMLLSSVSYGGFKVEHIRHHHVHVGTELDPTSSIRNQNVYHFVARCLILNPINAFKAEAQRLHRKKKSAWSLSNELILWYGLSLIFLLLYIHSAGMKGAIAFVLQSFIAAGLLESVNYLEHYGLRRKKHGNGRYEKVKPIHSWNADVYWSSIYLFQLPRHSDHHEVASKPYYELINHKQAPQLPMSYPSMVILALIPFAWFRVMNPRLDRHLESLDV